MKQTVRHPRRSGFTLIEMSIVLVIIGLIVGGILVGQDLIKAAQVRQTVTQLERFNTATNTFRIKYNCLPGDCANASQFGFTDQTGGTNNVNGNGDGQILGSPQEQEGCCITDPGRMENRNYWWILQQAKLTNDHVDYPIAPASCGVYGCGGGAGYFSPFPPISQRILQGNYMLGGWWLYYLSQNNSWIGSGSPSNFNGGHVFILNVCAGSGCLVANGNIIKPADLAAVDTKIDDGLPLTGNVLATNQGGVANFTPTTGAAGSSNCVNNSVTPNLYNVTNNGYLCSAIIKAGF